MKAKLNVGTEALEAGLLGIRNDASNQSGEEGVGWVLGVSGQKRHFRLWLSVIT